MSLRRLPPAAEAFEGDGEVAEVETFAEESDLEVVRIHSDLRGLVRDVRDRDDGVLGHGSPLSWRGRTRSDAIISEDPDCFTLLGDGLTRAPPGVTLSRVTDVRFARSGDVHVAYRVVGEGPIDLVYAQGAFTHLEIYWELPAFRRYCERLAEFTRLILFDKRGMGMSDRVPGATTLEERMDDVRAVMDAVGSERAAVMGESEGGPLAMLFAAAHPERTAALILQGAEVRERTDDEWPWGEDTEEEFESAMASLPERWGKGLGIDWVAPSVAGQQWARAFSEWEHSFPYTWNPECTLHVSRTIGVARSTTGTELAQANDEGRDREWWQGGDALKGAKTQRVSEAKTERNLDFLFYSRLYSEPRRDES